MNCQDVIFSCNMSQHSLTHNPRDLRLTNSCNLFQALAEHNKPRFNFLPMLARFDTVSLYCFDHFHLLYCLSCITKHFKSCTTARDSVGGTCNKSWHSGRIFILLRMWIFKLLHAGLLLDLVPVGEMHCKVAEM